MLRRGGCSGATAVRGIAGFGASTVIHTSVLLRLSMDLAVVIMSSIVPSASIRIVEPVRAMAPNALVTMVEVKVVQSGAPCDLTEATCRHMRAYGEIPKDEQGGLDTADHKDEFDLE